MKQIYKCYIKTLSPIHIGCDEIYEPIGFVVDESRNKLVSFDPITFISQMDENNKKRFSDICSRGTIESILEIYKFLRRKKTVGNRVQLCSGFVPHYNKTLSISTNNKKRIQQELSKFTIIRTSFLSMDNRPYIPGSSLKGSLRTSYLNLLAAKIKIEIQNKKDKQASKELEAKLLGYEKFKIETDPFRLVKVSDFMPVGNVQTKIVYAVNIKKESGGVARGPFQIVETIMPGSKFRGNIVVEEPLSDEIIKKPIQLEELLKSGRAFYKRELDREQGELESVGTSYPDFFFSQGSVLIRIGRHSGAESVTVEGKRNIKIMGGRGKGDRWKDHATTFWLASEEAKPKMIAGCRPFGWAELCGITPQIERKFEEIENNWSEEKSVDRKRFVTYGKKMDGDKSLTHQAHPSSAIEKEPISEIWENVVLSYAHNTGTVSTRFEGKNATVTDKSLVPEKLMVILKKKKKKKTVTATVKTELIGGKEYRLVEIRTVN